MLKVFKMGWERLLTDAVYHNNLDEVKKYLAKDDVRRAIGRREWAEATAPLHKASLAKMPNATITRSCIV